MSQQIYGLRCWNYGITIRAYVCCICLQRQKISEDLPGKATDSLAKANLDDSDKQGTCHFWMCTILPYRERFKKKKKW